MIGAIGRIPQVKHRASHSSGDVELNLYRIRFFPEVIQDGIPNLHSGRQR